MGSALLLSLQFLCLLLIPKNGANLKRYFHQYNGMTEDSSNNGGLNSKMLVPAHWNGTFVSIPGGYFHSHPLSSSSPEQADTSYSKQPPLNIDLRMGFMIGSARKKGDEEYSRPGLTIAGGISYALFSLQHSKFFGELSHPVNINFLLTVAETYGNEDTSLWQVAQLWKEHNVSVIIGPQETCLHEARLASSLNIPMISYFCSDEATSDKRQFPTFSRSRPPDAAISRAVASLVLSYGWCDSLTVIYSDSSDDQRFKRVAKSLSVLFRERNISTYPEISYRGPYHHGYGENPFDAIVAQTKATTRIYIIISEYFEHLGLVLALKKHNLLEDGEYLVIGVSMDDFKEDTWNPRRYFRGLLTDENEKEAPSAFRSYLGIVASAPKNFTEFSRRVNHFMEMEPFRFQNPLLKFGAYKNIRIEAAYLYDAVMLYAHVVRDILQEYFWSVFSTNNNPTTSNNIGGSEASHNVNNGTVDNRQETFQQQTPIRQLQQRLIPLGMNPKLAIRHRRDHAAALTNNSRASGSAHTSFLNVASERGREENVFDEDKLFKKIKDGREVSRRMRNIRYNSATGHETKMDENGDAEGNFTLVALKNKNGEFGLYPVGFFMRSSAPLPKLTLTDKIDWVGKNPPVSKPECGFHGEKCESETLSMWALGTGTLTITFLLSALFLVYRHWRISRDMDTLLWRIDKKDIEWETGRIFPAVCGEKGRLIGGFGGLSTGSQASLAKFSSVFAPLVSYRGRIFAAKALNLCHLDAGLKHQLKMLREIRHENLNPFVGALFDEGLLLVYEYCSRGSIKDILENGDLKLDDMFVSSLVGDLLRGLSYLHDSSQFRYHGNLKPSNCLIDSRWNLKLSDFGLKPFEYKLRRTTDLIVPPTCNLASTTGGIAGGGSGGTEDKIGSVADTGTYVGGGGGTQQNYSTQQSTGRASQSFGSSFHGHVLTQITSPYLAPEYPLLIKHEENIIMEELELMKQLKDKARPGFGHCSSINIELRQKQVRCNRDFHWISKKLEGIQREHVKNMRKFDSAQRGLMLLIGESPYPDCSREEASFLHNQPGFCFRRDGTERYFSSLHESKSRKILSDMDGKEGLRPNPALNVVSDTPTLAEILSSPELVQILCELRNTAALMKDEHLFQAFADQLAKSHKKFPFFKEFQGPLDYLKQYRRNLIQEFFDTLKTEAEMRLFVVPVDQTTNLLQEEVLVGLDEKSRQSSGNNKSGGSANDKSSTAIRNSSSHNNSDNSNIYIAGLDTTTTSKEDENNRSNDSATPNLIDRLEIKVKKNKKTFAGAPAPLTFHPKDDNNSNLQDMRLPESDARRKIGDYQHQYQQQNKQNDDSDANSVHNEDSKQDIFAPTDFIPTSEGYMTVEDWNYAVLQQLQKARDDELRKKVARGGGYRASRNFSTTDTASIQRKSRQQLLTSTINTEAPTTTEKAVTKKFDRKKKITTLVDDETEQLQNRMAAAKVAEDEAKYRLDQKIMGLAGITSLYKSNNIGFSKYFEQKEDMLGKELKRRDEKEDDGGRTTHRRRKHRNSRKLKDSKSKRGGDGNWLEPPPVRFQQSNESLKMNGEENISRENRKSSRAIRRKTSSNFSTSSASEFSSVIEEADADHASRMRLNGIARSNRSRRIMKSKSKMKRASTIAKTKIFHRQEFDAFVKGLISNIEEISAVGKQVSGLSKRRPVQVKQIIHPLLRLLKRDDLFETLNDEDIFFSEFEGGKKELEKMVESQLPPVAKPKPGAFTFKLPSRTSIKTVATGGDVSSIAGGSDRLINSLGLEEYYCYPNSISESATSSRPQSARGSSANKPSSAASNPMEADLRWSKINLKNEPIECLVQGVPRSLQRVCCPACRAKTQLACNSVLRRDKNCKVTMSLNSWKIPGMNTPHWIRKQKEQDSLQLTDPYYPQKLISKVPVKLRKAYESAFPIYVDEKERSRSVFLNPPSLDIMNLPPVKQAAPTPVYLKKKLYPLPAVTRITPSEIATNLQSKTSKPIRLSQSLGMNMGTGQQTRSGHVIHSRKWNDKDSLYSLLPDTKPLFPEAELKDTKAPPPPPTLRLDRSTKFRSNLSTNLKHNSRNDGLELNANRNSISGKGTESQTNFESWTLKVSKFDILRLRHELDGESVKEKMANFEAKFLRPNSL